MEENVKMAVKRRFERINIMITRKSYIKYENIPENKDIFVYGFKHIKKDKIKNYILIGCESVEIYDKVKLFNIWSNKFINKEREKRNFKITGWSFMTLVKETTFFTIHSMCL